MEIKVIDQDFSICKLENMSGINYEDEFFFLGKQRKNCLWYAVPDPYLIMCAAVMTDGGHSGYRGFWIFP